MLMLVAMPAKNLSNKRNKFSDSDILTFITSLLIYRKNEKQIISPLIIHLEFNEKIFLKIGLKIPSKKDEYQHDEDSSS